MGKLAIAMCVACLASANATNVTEYNHPHRSTVRIAATAEPTVMRTSREAVDERVTRMAVRAAFAPDRQPSQQELLALLVLYAATRHDNAKTGN